MRTTLSIPSGTFPGCVVDSVACDLSLVSAETGELALLIYGHQREDQLVRVWVAWTGGSPTGSDWFGLACCNITCLFFVNKKNYMSENNSANEHYKLSMYC
jgi:hypothetical protein